MTPADRAKYLEARRRRTHFAIKCKRVLGEYVPMTGPLDEDPVPKMMHDLINFRAGLQTKPSDVQNLITNLSRTKDLASALEIYIQPSVSHHRRVMTARRIAHRLGLIEERADWSEKQRRWDAMYGLDADYHTWVTQKPLRWSSGVNLSAGARVYYGGNGTFYTGGDRSIRISAEEAEQIGVRRLT